MPLLDSPRESLAAIGRARQDTLTTFAAVFGVIVALYFGRELFVPLAIALLFSFALAMPVTWLHRHGAPRLPAVIGVVFLALVALSAFAAVIAFQVAELAGNLPSYERNLQAKIHSVQGTLLGDGIFRRASTMLNELGKDLANPAPTSAPGAILTPPPAVEVQPIPVTISPPDPAPLEIAQTFLGPLIRPVTTGGIVIVFVIFILLQREDLRDRFIRLAGSRDLHRTTHALGEAGARVSRYLATQLVINILYAVPVGVGLWLIGVPNPVLWGVLALGLRFVPYVGPVIAAAFPLALALAVDPGWSTVLLTAALFIGLELISNNAIEPWLYGSRTGLSPIAIILSAIFWSWLWGPVGLLLSTPLTVCLVSFAQHVPQLEFLNVLLGNEQALAPDERLYQRLLAGDPDEATEQAEAFIKDNSLPAFYDQVGIPMLAIAERDRERGALDATQRARIASGAATVVENLTEGESAPAAAAVEPKEGTVADAAPVPAAAPRLLLSAGGRRDLDDAAALMLAHIAERAGASVQRVPAGELQGGGLGRLPWDRIDMVCLSYVGGAATAHSRFLVRRLRRRAPKAKVLVGFWTLDPSQAQRPDVTEAVRADAIATTLAGAMEAVAKEMRLPVAPVVAPAAGEPAQSVK